MALIVAAIALCSFSPDPAERALQLIEQHRLRHKFSRSVYVEQWETINEGKSRWWFKKPSYLKSIDRAGNELVSGPGGSFSRKAGRKWERVPKGPVLLNCHLSYFYPSFFGAKFEEANREGRVVKLTWNGKPRKAYEMVWAYGEPHIFSMRLLFDAKSFRPLMFTDMAPDPSSPNYPNAGFSIMRESVFPVIRWGINLSPGDFGPAGRL